MSDGTFSPEWKNYMADLGAFTSLRYPKLEAPNHWSHLIQHIGPPYTMNTKRYEHFHGVLKAFVEQSNHKDTLNTILSNVSINYDVIKYF